MTTQELIAQIRNALPPEGEFSNDYSDPIFHLAREAANRLEELIEQNNKFFIEE